MTTTSSFSLPPPFRSRGFTLLEILLASSAAALILLAVYGIFSRAIKLRDNATQRTHDARLRARATKTIRNDLRNALISGGLLASTLTGSSTGSDGLNNSGFPGYLKFTATTGKDAANEFYGDVQQVEYYIVRDATNASGGTLVRAINRDLLASVQQPAAVEQILTGVRSLQVSFFDGANWQTSWQFASNTTSSSTTGGIANQTLPEAIRVEIAQAAASPREPAPPPLEILVPWTTQPFAAATPAPSASSAASATPTRSPTPTPAASPKATR